MTRTRGRDWRGIGCAAVLGAAIAFPVGLFVGSERTPRDKAPVSSRPGPATGETRTGRNVYSPRIASDPYVIEQQRKVIQALDASCRQHGQHCGEAEQARRRIEEAEAAR